MSTATATSDTSPRKVLPAEINNVLTAYWLGVSLVLLTVAAAFFVLVDAKQPPFANESGATTLGWLLLIVLVGGLIALASVVANAFAQGRPAGFHWMRIAVIVGVIVMLGALAAAVAVPMLGGSPGGLLGPAPVLGSFLLMLLAFLPFVFLILALSQSRSDAVRAYFWPESTGEEGAGVAVEEPPVEEETAAEEGPYEPGPDYGETAEYRAADAEEFVATQELSPAAPGSIYVDQDLAGTPGGSGYGPESSGTRALEAMPEAEPRVETPEGSDWTPEEQPRDVVEQAEAEPPADNIHDESFTPSEPILLPDSGIVPQQEAKRPASEPEVLIGSDPVIMVPEQGPARKVTMFADKGETPVAPIPPSQKPGGPSESDIVVDELLSDAVIEGAGRKKKDTKVAPDAAEQAAKEDDPSSPAGTVPVPGLKQPKK